MVSLSLLKNYSPKFKHIMGTHKSRLVKKLMRPHEVSILVNTQSFRRTKRRGSSLLSSWDESRITGGRKRRQIEGGK